MIEHLQSRFQNHSDSQCAGEWVSRKRATGESSRVSIVVATQAGKAMGRCLAAALGIVLFSSVAPAQAAHERTRHSSGSAKEKAAKKACVTGDVKTGIDILGDLYVDTADATYVFNQGRCYEQNRRLEDAIDRFREYLRKIPDAPAKDKAEANAHIADCEALLAKQTGRTTAPAPQAPPQPILAAVPPAQVQPPLAVVPAQTLVPRSDGRGLRIAGAITTAAGICAVGTGVILASKERSLTNEINAKYSQSKESTRASYESWGYVTYGVGAAAMVGGAVLYYLGWRSGQAGSASTGMSLLPTLIPDGMTLVMQGSY
jgi:hypothetical protein